MAHTPRPSIFLIGAMKAGTSTIAALLGQQPGIFLSSVKEPNFFKSRQAKLPYAGPISNIDQWANVSWTEQDYNRLFAGATADQLVLDASTAYLVNPEAPSMIREYCPTAKVIVCLRNPIERAYSAYNFMSVGAGDPAATFEEAIAGELAGERDGWLFGWRYLYGGKYDEHLQSWLAEFPSERILVLDFEQLIRSPAATIEAICTYLDIDFDPALIQSERENATAIPGPINRFVRRTLINPGAWKTMLKPLIPHEIRHRLKRDTLKALRKVGASPTKMSDQTRAMLEEYYLPHIRNTEALLARSFGQTGDANPATRWLAATEARTTTKAEGARFSSR
jgi:hypothetical protein